MDLELFKFEKIRIGWEISFRVIFNDDELSNFNPEKLKHIGDYEINFKDNNICFDFIFDHGELRESETIEERLELIEKDILQTVKSCLK